MGWILNQNDGSRIYDEETAFRQSLERALCTERGTRIGRPEYGISHRRFRHRRRTPDAQRELAVEIRAAVVDLIDVTSLDFEILGDDTRVTINGDVQVVLKT